MAIVRATDIFSFFFSLLVISSASFPFHRFCAMELQSFPCKTETLRVWQSLTLKLQTSWQTKSSNVRLQYGPQNELAQGLQIKLRCKMRPMESGWIGESATLKFQCLLEITCRRGGRSRDALPTRVVSYKPSNDYGFLCALGWNL